VIDLEPLVIDCHDCGQPLTIRVTLGPEHHDGRTVFETHVDHQALADHHACHEDV
jgi:hypothetical protein